MKFDYEDQIDSIRVGIYEKTKDMSNVDAASVANEHARKIAEQYGIKMIRAESGYDEQQ